MKVAIVGAGFMGLTAARLLEKQGHAVTVYEAGPTPGGYAQTYSEGDWRSERGPSTLAAGADALTILKELHVTDQLVEASAAAGKRFLVHNGLPVEVPSKPPALLASSLFSLSAKWRVIREPSVPPLGADSPDESVADFVRRRLNAEWLERAVGPFVSGVFAGDPEKLSLRHAFPRMHAVEMNYGSLVTGMRKMGAAAARKLYSSPTGLGGLTAAMAAPLRDTRYGAAVTSIRKNDNRWLVETAARQEPVDAIVLTVGAEAAAALLQIIGVNIAKQLRAIDHPPLAVVHHGYRRQDVTHAVDGFGALIPRSAGLRTLGVLFPSSMFSGRAPEGHVLLSSFLGGALDRKTPALPPNEIQNMAATEAAKLFGITGKPVWSRVEVVPRSIPQYEVGYAGVLNALQAFEANNPGLYLRGNYVGGPALADRLAAGAGIAKEIAT